ncbi:MAG: hypothetical protein FGM33_01535 [Candidatus Kapabacteria bacterium]|nr:hypothetical protein [Candidatus Kapabacteria bacterium]
MMNRTIALVALLVLGFANVIAQESLSKERPKPEPKKEPAMVSRRVMSVGAHASYGIMMNGVTSFRLPSVASCCPGYASTSGSGMVFGAEFMVPMSKTIDIGGRVVYQSASTDFASSEPITVRAGNGTLSSSIEHTLSTTTTFLLLEPVASLGLGGGLSVLGGLRIGTTLGGTYDQQERLKDPSLPYNFPTGSGLYNVSSADIPNTSGLQAGAIIGLRYSAPLAGGLSINPEVTYSPMFTDVITDAAWTITPLRFGVSILFDVNTREAASTPIQP